MNRAKNGSYLDLRFLLAPNLKTEED
jgi:hypothetical protein